MKRIAALVLALLLALCLLAGCTPEQQADTPPTAGNTETTGQTEDTDPTDQSVPAESTAPTEDPELVPGQDGIELPDVPL